MTPKDWESQLTDLETRLTDLEIENGALRTELHAVQEELRLAARRFDDLNGGHNWLRKRLASFYPERNYCPECKTLLHSTATACRCGWGARPDPKAGLPR